MCYSVGRAINLEIPVTTKTTFILALAVVLLVLPGCIFTNVRVTPNSSSAVSFGNYGGYGGYGGYYYQMPPTYYPQYPARICWHPNIGNYYC